MANVIEEKTDLAGNRTSIETGTTAGEEGRSTTFMPHCGALTMEADTALILLKPNCGIWDTSRSCAEIEVCGR